MTLSRVRFPLLALAILTLVVATFAGLMRLGWKVPTLNPTWMAAHGPLMLSGFLGTLIGVERAVALGNRWMYTGPALAGLGGVSLFGGLPPIIAQTLIILGSIGFLAIFVVILKRHFALYTVTMASGAVAWLVGNVVWMVVGRVPNAVPWWAGFLILTIAGERLELGRLGNIPRRVWILYIGLVGLFVTGLAISLIHFDWGVRLAGVGMIGLAAWLLRYDIARKTIRKPDLTRFIAVCMLSGYVWLIIGGILAILFGGVTGGAIYDALLHSIFLGFVFSMIFGHAPIIFPAILSRPIHFTPRFYIHLAALHLSLILRVYGGLTDSFVLRRWGGMLNGIALLLFLASTMMAILKSGETS